MEWRVLNSRPPAPQSNAIIIRPLRPPPLGQILLRVSLIVLLLIKVLLCPSQEKLIRKICLVFNLNVKHELLRVNSNLLNVSIPIQVYYPQRGANPNSTLHVLIASYTWGRDADRYGGMSQDDIIKECLQV